MWQASLRTRLCCAGVVHRSEIWTWLFSQSRHADKSAIIHYSNHMTDMIICALDKGVQLHMIRGMSATTFAAVCDINQEDHAISVLLAMVRGLWTSQDQVPSDAWTLDIYQRAKRGGLVYSHEAWTWIYRRGGLGDVRSDDYATVRGDADLAMRALKGAIDSGVGVNALGYMSSEDLRKYARIAASDTDVASLQKRFRELVVLGVLRE